MCGRLRHGASFPSPAGPRVLHPRNPMRSRTSLLELFPGCRKVQSPRLAQRGYSVYFHSQRPCLQREGSFSIPAGDHTGELCWAKRVISPPQSLRGGFVLINEPHTGPVCTLEGHLFVTGTGVVCFRAGASSLGSRASIDDQRAKGVRGVSAQ